MMAISWISYALPLFGEQSRRCSQSGVEAPRWRVSDIERVEKVDAQRLFQLIQNWLVTHILGEDRKYVPFLTSHTAKPVGQWKRSNGRDC